MRLQFDVPPKYLLDAPMFPGTVSTRVSVPLRRAILIRNFSTDLGRQDPCQSPRITRPEFPKADRTAITETTQAANQLAPHADVRTAEPPETPPNALRPVERRKRGRREPLKLLLTGILQTDDRTKNPT